MSRSDSARIAALTLHAKRDSHAIAAKARRGFDARFEREVDPGNVLSPEDRRARVERLKSAYFLRLAHRSAEVRRARKAAATAA